MSAIQKKPYIRNVLDSMEDEEKVTLLQLVDGKQNKPTPKSLINPSQHITGADKLLTPEYIALETKEGVYTGYLIYNDDYCTLVAYEDGSQNLDILDIDLSNMTYSVNKENTSIADMRFEIEQSKEKMDVVDYIKEALEEGQIVVDGGALVVSLSNVDLSTGTASAALSSDDFSIAADEDKPCVLQMGLSTQSVWPVGDLVELNRISVVANTSATFAGVVNGCVINAVFTSGAGTVTIKNDGARIVEITATGVQTEAKGAEIEAADAVKYDNAIYWRQMVSGTDYYFRNVSPNTYNLEIYYYYLSYSSSTRSVSANTSQVNYLNRNQIVSSFSSSASYAVGDIVYYSMNLYRCTTAHNGAWDATHFTQVVLADEISTALKSAGDIVEITATGVQSDEMAAKIENAKAIYYDTVLYTKINDDTLSIYFSNQAQSANVDYENTLSYTRSSKSVSQAQYSRNRVSGIDSKRGSVSVDSSLQTTGSATAGTLGLTGKLPYLDTLPSSDNTSGFLTIVKCTSEPAAADRHEGYLYIVVPAAQ